MKNGLERLWKERVVTSDTTAGLRTEILASNPGFPIFRLPRNGRPEAVLQVTFNNRTGTN